MSDKYILEKIIAIEKEYLKDNNDIALEIINEVTKKGKKNLKIDELEGLIYLKKNNQEMALNKLKKASIAESFTDYSRLQLAELFIKRNLIEEGIDQLKKIEKKQKKNLDILLKIADCYIKNKDYENSLYYLKKIETIDGSIAGIQYNIGRIYDELNIDDLALQHYKKTTEINSTLPQPLINIGVILQRQKKFKEAVIYYEKAYELNKKIKYVLGDILYCYKNILDLKKYKIYLDKLEKKGEVLENIEPFQYLSISDSPEHQLVVARNFIKNKISDTKIGYTHKKNKKILKKIAYISADFKLHPTSHLLIELIENHDKNKFEVIIISLARLDQSDPMTRRYLKSCTQLIDVSKLNDEELVVYLRKLELEIAVDLMGYTTLSRPEIFKSRIAPIQINYLGYPGTMGMNQVDYIVGDKNLIPELQRKFYTEKIIYLPLVFQPYDTKKLIGSSDKSNNCIDLIKITKNENRFIYLCFNSLHKINEEVLLCWVKILSEVKNGVLWIVINDDLAKKNLVNFFKLHSINENKLVFTEQTNYLNYLQNYSHADLFLDTWPFNAGATCRDAIWAGLPVLTKEGQSFAGRMATSILYAADCHELVAKDSNEYIKIAIELAKRQEKIKYIKEKIIKAKLSKLFDMKTYTKDIEKAYSIVIEANDSGYETKDIYL